MSYEYRHTLSINMEIFTVKLKIQITPLLRSPFVYRISQIKDYHEYTVSEER